MPQYLDYGFQNKAAIVTGAGTGIGNSVAVELAKGGAKVALFGRRLERLEQTKIECLKYTDKVLALSVDVSDEKSVQENVAKVINEFGTVDILVNNAGFESHLEPGQTYDDIFDKLQPEEYLKFFRVHALGHYLMDRSVLPGMIKNNFGRIVNVTSVTAVNGGFTTPAYTGSKAAANCQTMSFARKYGKYNITVNAVAPGCVLTPMNSYMSSELEESIADMTPMRRVAQPLDISRVALFFAQENLFVTGQVLIADGGGILGK